MTALRIAMIGQRGVPATYGGIERHVEEIGARLASMGHDVHVFCRRSYEEAQPAEHRGMHLWHLSAPDSKHLEAIAHAARSTAEAMRLQPDVIHYHALGPGLVAPLPRLFSHSRVVLTVHGLDDERAKWNAAARRVLRVAQWMSARVPDTTIGVSRALVSHYADRHGREIAYIPNGVDTPAPRPPAEVVERFGLRPGSYVLFVGRFVPEKAPDLLIRAFRGLGSDATLVLAGGSSNTDEYVAGLHRLAGNDPRIVFPGYVYGDALRALYSNAAAFVQPSAVEGLPLTLLEAASYGLPLVVSDIAPNLEVVGGDGAGHRVFRCGREDELRAAIDQVLHHVDGERAGALALREDVLGRYSWDRAAEEIEHVYLTGSTAERAARPAGARCRPVERPASAPSDTRRDRAPAPAPATARMR